MFSQPPCTEMKISLKEEEEVVVEGGWLCGWGGVGGVQWSKAHGVEKKKFETMPGLI